MTPDRAQERMDPLSALSGGLVGSSGWNWQSTLSSGTAISLLSLNRRSILPAEFKLAQHWRSNLPAEFEMAQQWRGNLPTEFELAQHST